MKQKEDVVQRDFSLTSCGSSAFHVTFKQPCPTVEAKSIL
jgi:hypothetical protein